MAEVASEVIVARTGRNCQRYEEKFRLVAGCIPYRLKTTVENGADNLQDRLEVLMISSPNRQDLIFPKGGWENDETIVEAASREALEEAGVRGIIKEPILGEWKFSSKSRQNSCSSEGTCKGYMFAMEVTEELQCWPEQASHDRRWLCTSDAWKICRYDWMREALSSCISFVSGQTILPEIILCEHPDVDQSPVKKRHITSCSESQLGTTRYLLSTVARYCSLPGDVAAPNSPPEVNYIQCPHEIISPILQR